MEHRWVHRIWAQGRDPGGVCTNTSPFAHLDILFFQVVVNDSRVALAAPLSGDTVLRRFHGRAVLFRHPAHRTAELPALASPQSLPSQAKPYLAQGKKQVLQDAIGLGSDIFLSLHLEIWDRGRSLLTPEFSQGRVALGLVRCLANGALTVLLLFFPKDFMFLFMCKGGGMPRRSRSCRRL